MKKKSLLSIGLIILSSMLIGCTSKSEKAEKFRIERNYEEAAKLYEEMAEDGDSYAMWRLSNAYRKGQGVNVDLQKAKSLLKESAKTGCEQAIFDLAYNSMIRIVSGEVIIDTKIPAEIENLVSKSKNPYVLSRYAELAIDFLIPPRKALSVMNSITNKEDPSYLLAIGKFYKLGIDTLKANHIKAIKSLEKAFEHGEDDAAIQLAYIYEYCGNKDILNKEKTKEWLCKGAECGDPRCISELAKIYRNSKKEYGGYNDFMLNDKGKPIGFNIGTFNDIDKFDPEAQKDFSTLWVIKGITYIIYPSKDASDITMISLPKAVLCSSRRVYDDRTKKCEMRYYGPVIYHKGAKYEYYDGMNTKQCKGWQPICAWMNVRLTPKATKKVYGEILPLLRKLKGIQIQGGKLVTKDGIFLTSDEEQLLESLGIWNSDGKFEKLGKSIILSLNIESME